ncbi:MAG: hypothetical protein GY824_09455, partial [Delftia sp.]|nr:hypothetical protein [Delftia sp.]
MLRTQLCAAKDVIGRIQAGHELAQTGKRANIQAIVAAYANEPFWGARVEFAKSLGKANTEAAVAGLVEMIGLEQDPLVLPSLFGAAGNYRDRRIRDAIAARLQGELPHTAAQAAYQALGAQRRDAPWEVLVDGAGRDSFNGYAQAGALRGLAATRRPQAVDFLMEKVVYGATSNGARPAAVAALADIGQGQEKATRERIVERLIDLLRDPWADTRRSAALGLQTLKAPQAIAALEAFAQTLSHQERVEVERGVQS